MKWFRFWNDTVNDVKMLQLSDYEYRIWTYLLSYASSIDSVSGELQTTFKLLSLHFHQRFNLFSHAIETFHRLGLISLDDSGNVTITNWNKRQFKSDYAYARVKKFRSVTKKRNVSETAPETETDTDKKEIIKKEKILFTENHFINIPDDLKKKWVSIAPGVSVDSEITKAEAWVLSNPKLKKSNWSRFLTNWMIRAQDRVKGGGNGNGRYGAGGYGVPAGRDQPKEYTGDDIPAIDEQTRKANIERARSITRALGKNNLPQGHP